MFSPRPPLDSRVFPHDHRNPVPAARYNLVVIGAGTAGLVCAAGAAGLGARVALIERRALGGDCLNVGCVPSKTLIRSARAAHAVREAAAFGVQARITAIDFAAVMARVRDVRYRISAHDSVERFRSLGVDVFLGDARFASRETVEVAGVTLRFARAVIATGGRPTIPDVPGLRDGSPFTNESVFEITEQPARLLVIGGGPVGCELAQAFQRLGTTVTVVQSAPRLLGREADDVAAIVRNAFEADGVRVYTSSRVTLVEPGQGGHRVFIERDGLADEIVDADAILVAAGRAPNVEDLGLDVAGVEVGTPRRGVREPMARPERLSPGEHADRGVREPTPQLIAVDDFLRTSNPVIYAAGDVCLPEQFTHAADASARVVIQNALFLGRKRASRLMIPRCTYTDPEVAHVGETPRETDSDVQRYDVSWDSVDRAMTDGESIGGVHLYARGAHIVGGTIVGRDAGDLIGEIAVLVAEQTSLSTLAGIVHPYPTRADAIRRAGDLYNRTRLTPVARRLFERWLAWRRS